MKRFLSNQFFDFVLGPLIVLALSYWLVADFIKTRRAVKHGEPLRVWYLREPVYPGELQYFLIAFQRKYPAIILFTFVGLIILCFGGLVIWAIFWPPGS